MINYVVFTLLGFALLGLSMVRRILRWLGFYDFVDCNSALRNRRSKSIRRQTMAAFICFGIAVYSAIVW